MVALYRFLLACVTFFLCLSTVTLADDFNLPVQPPSLHFVTPLINTSIEVYITEKNVRFLYRITNPTSAHLKYTMLLTTPRYSWRGMSENNPDRSYADLVVRNNSGTVVYHKKTEAFLETKNVTAVLHNYSIDPNIVADDRLFRDGMEINSTTLLALIEQQLFDEKSFSPTWSVKNTYFWVQKFPPNQEQIIEYSYEPLWGSMTVGDFSSANLIMENFDWHRIMGEFYLKRINGFFTPSHVQESIYNIRWLRFPLTVVSCAPIEKVIISAEVSGEQLIFLSYGDMYTASVAHAELRYEYITGTDEIGIVIVTPID